MIQQNNISYDSYFGRIIDPSSYKILNYLKGVLGTSEKYITDLHNHIFEKVQTYIEINDPKSPPKNEYIQILYYICMNCFIKLKQVNYPLQNIMQPSNKKEYLILKLYLIPLLDTIAEISPTHEEFNKFSHDYLLNNEIPKENIFIIENITSGNIRIIEKDPKEFEQYLKDNNISVNISGALFYTHEYKLGSLYQFLTDRIGMRNEYKNKMKEFKYGSDEYEFNNRRQLVMKVNANSAYGLMGLNTFRFSNKWLAKSTTISGRLCLKIAQLISETYLEQLKNKG